MIDQLPEAASQISLASGVWTSASGAWSSPEDLVLAYIGPGAGLAAIGALIAVAGVGATTIFGLVWYPVREIRRKLRESRNDVAKSSRSQVVPDTDREP